MMGVEGEEPQGQEKDMVEVVAEVVAMVGLRRGEGAEEVTAWQEARGEGGGGEGRRAEREARGGQAGRT
jgi:hypothetical protein